jgi:hypothetical protein
MEHEYARSWTTGSHSCVGVAGRVQERGRACTEPRRRAALLKRSLLTAALLLLAPPTNALFASVADSGTQSCVGDCGEDRQITVDEILNMVNIALGNSDVSDCNNGDNNDDSQITVDEILTAVNFALNGCPIPDVSGTWQRDQAAVLSSTCDDEVKARVQSNIDAGEWDCTYEVVQSGPDLTITETCTDGTDVFSGTVDSSGRIIVVRTGQETEGSCTLTETSYSEVNGSASSSTGTNRLQFDFSTGCAFADCEIVVESRFTRL